MFVSPKLLGTENVVGIRIPESGCTTIEPFERESLHFDIPSSLPGNKLLCRRRPPAVATSPLRQEYEDVPYEDHSQSLKSCLS